MPSTVGGGYQSDRPERVWCRSDTSPFPKQESDERCGSRTFSHLNADFFGSLQLCAHTEQGTVLARVAATALRTAAAAEGEDEHNAWSHTDSRRIVAVDH